MDPNFLDLDNGTLGDPVNCLVCGKRTWRREQGENYCSWKCWSEQNQDKRAKGRQTCRHCGKSFVDFMGYNTGYCGRDCEREAAGTRYVVINNRIRPTRRDEVEDAEDWDHCFRTREAAEKFLEATA